MLRASKAWWHHTWKHECLRPLLLLVLTLLWLWLGLGLLLRLLLLLLFSRVHFTLVNELDCGAAAVFTLYVVQIDHVGVSSIATIAKYITLANSVRC